MSVCNYSIMVSPDYTSQLDSALCGLLPSGVEYAVGPIPEAWHFEFDIEGDSLRAAGDYRKCEFVAGRDCARTALEKVGFARAPILPDEYGVPVWPEGSLATISHSRGYCAAIAAKAADYCVLGLDLEMTNRLSASAIKRTVHPDEQIYVQSDQKKASLLFCAKEAFFKAQFPIWHTHANFHDLILTVDEAKGKMTILRMGERFPSELRSLAADIQFRFSFFGDFVVTACWMESSL